MNVHLLIKHALQSYVNLSSKKTSSPLRFNEKKERIKIEKRDIYLYSGLFFTI